MPSPKPCPGRPGVRSGLSLEPLLAVVVRRARSSDLAGIAEVQAASSEAAQWGVSDYLSYDLFVAVYGDRIAGFAVARRLVEGEAELLNLAVHPTFRRRGIGRRLFAELTSGHPGDFWLEVRESNTAARNFYKNLGLREAGRRSEYYDNSGEDAIVMNFHS
jgi:[ribosomal protein S18]-alanine N-acetyltransferase